MNEETISMELSLQKYAAEALLQLHRDLNQILAEAWSNQAESAIRAKVSAAMAASLRVIV